MDLTQLKFILDIFTDNIILLGVIVRVIFVNKFINIVNAC